MTEGGHVSVCVCVVLPSLSYQFSWLCPTLHSSQAHKLRKWPFLCVLFLFLSALLCSDFTTQYNSSVNWTALLVYGCHQRRNDQCRSPTMGGRAETETGAQRFFFYCCLFDQIINDCKTSKWDHQTWSFKQCSFLSHSLWICWTNISVRPSQSACEAVFVFDIYSNNIWQFTAWYGIVVGWFTDILRQGKFIFEAGAKHRGKLRVLHGLGLGDDYWIGMWHASAVKFHDGRSLPHPCPASISVLGLIWSSHHTSVTLWLAIQKKLS